MQIPISYWKMRIRPGIAEIFFHAVRRSRIRPFLSCFVLVSWFACFFYSCAVRNKEQNRTLYTWEKPHFSLPVFSHNKAIWRLQEMHDWFWVRENWGWRRHVEQLDLLLTSYQQLVSQQHWTGSVLAFCASLDKDSHQKEKWNLFFKV